MDATQYLQFARVAYLRQADLSDALSHLGCELMRSFDVRSTDTQGYLGRLQNDELVLAFRGTEIGNIRDLQSDLRYGKEDHRSGGKVHGGFRQSALSVVNLVSERLDPGDRVHITGHSLGAAIATLVAWDLSELVTVAGVQTFGSPRVGDALFAAAYNQRLKSVTARHQNGPDIVTRMPSVAQGFWHVGQLRYYDCFGLCHTDSSWWYRAWDSLATRAMNIGKVPTSGIRHHFLDSYAGVKLR